MKVFTLVVNILKVHNSQGHFGRALLDSAKVFALQMHKSLQL